MPTDFPGEAASDANLAPALTPRLVAKIAELRELGYTILWIAVSPADLIQLFSEGGDQAILMDPNPASDVAWFGDYEVRPSPTPGTWVYLSGEYDQISRHEA